jgi:glycolate oxidase iron-sulfur subunit
MHLIDHARSHIEKTYKRPFMNRFLRGVLAQVLPYPGRFRLALQLAKLGRPFASLFRKSDTLRPVAAMLDLAPQYLPARQQIDAISPAKGEKRGPGCNPQWLRATGAQSRHQRCHAALA